MRPPKVLVVAHPVAVAANVDDVAMMEQAIDQRSGHEIVTEDLAPFVEGLVRGQDGGGGFVAAGHELEEEHGVVAIDREVADLVDDQDRRVPKPDSLGGRLTYYRSAPMPCFWRTFGRPPFGMHASTTHAIVPGFT